MYKKPEQQASHSAWKPLFLRHINNFQPYSSSRKKCTSTYTVYCKIHSFLLCFIVFRPFPFRDNLLFQSCIFADTINFNTSTWCLSSKNKRFCIALFRDLRVSTNEYIIGAFNAQLYDTSLRISPYVPPFTNVASQFSRSTCVYIHSSTTVRLEVNDLFKIPTIRIENRFSAVTYCLTAMSRLLDLPLGCLV